MAENTEPSHLKFSTVEEGEKALRKHQDLRDRMGGALWWGVCNDECKEIEQKLWTLRYREKVNKLDNE